MWLPRRRFLSFIPVPKWPELSTDMILRAEVRVGDGIFGNCLALSHN